MPAHETVHAELDLALLENQTRRSARALERVEALALDGLPEEVRLRAVEVHARALIGLWRTEEARVELERALAAGTSMPIGQRATLTWLLALALAMQRDDERAAELLDEALANAELALGEDHPNTALVRHLAGVQLGRIGHVDEAIGHLERSLETLDAVFGPTNRHSPYVASDLADLEMERGDAEAAAGLYRRALASLPPKDPDLHVHRRARVCVRLALLSEAAGEFEDLLAEACRLMGLSSDGPFDRDAPSIQLARALAREGRYADVVRLYERVLSELPDSERTSERTLSLWNNLAVAWAHLGRFERAEPMYRETLAVRRRLLGPDHVRTTAVEGNLALLLLRSGRPAEAEPLLRHAIGVCTAEIGAEHARTGRLRRHLAATLRALGRHAEALVESEHALATVLAAYSDDASANVGDTWLVHGECLLANGRHDAAREALLRARGILESQRLPDADLLARASRALADCNGGR